MLAKNIGKVRVIALIFIISIGAFPLYVSSTSVVGPQVPKQRVELSYPSFDYLNKVITLNATIIHAEVNIFYSHMYYDAGPFVFYQVQIYSYGKPIMTINLTETQINDNNKPTPIRIALSTALSPRIFDLHLKTTDGGTYVRPLTILDQ